MFYFKSLVFNSVNKFILKTDNDKYNFYKKK